MRKIIGVLAFLSLFFGSFANADIAVNIIGDELRYNEISARLSDIDASLKKANITSEALVNDIAYLRQKRMQLENSRQDIENAIKFVEKRVEALGEAPADGNEIKIIAEKRIEFRDELAKERARLSEADLLLARMEELDLAIFNLRNQELWGNLLKTSEPLIYPRVMFDSAKMLIDLVFDIIHSPYPWYQKQSSSELNMLKNKIMPAAIVMLFIAMLGIVLRYLIMRYFGYQADIEHPRFGRKIIAALSVFIAYGAIPTLIIGLLLFWLVDGKLLTGGLFGAVLNSFLYYSLFVILSKAIVRVIFTPYNERWRLINIPTEKAKRVTIALYFSVFVIGVLSFLQHIVNIQNYPIELMTFLVGLSASVKAFLVVWILHRLVWENSFVQEEVEDEEETEDSDNMVVKITLISLFVAIGILGLSLFGYPYLAAFITDRIILSIFLMAGFVGLRKIINEILHRVLFLKFWFKTFRMRRRVIRRLDFWSSFLVDPLLAFSCLFIFLALWGVPADTLRNIVYRIFTGFTIGDIRFSLLSIIFGVAVFFIAIAIVKALRQKIETGVLARIEMEEGTRHSLAAGFSSIGYVASALLAIVIMGGNLTSLALVAGALSVGIGLGLQNVVNNFVSGIILLFERPVKVGDWVIINGEEGRIKQINIRSTEMETFKKSSLIIPNADLLSTTVTNLTHGNNWSRQAVKVGVAYGSDTQKVKEILLDCARSHKKVLRKPEPYVLFQDFGSSSLDFELRCYTNDIWSGWEIPSDLRYEINKRFAAEGIEIPFSQIVVHTGSEVAKETENMFYASKRKGKKNAD